MHNSKRSLSFFFAFVLLIAPAKQLLAADFSNFDGTVQRFKDADGETDVMAENIEYSFASEGPEANWTTLTGKAAIRYRGFELRADKMRYNSKTGDAEASGNVVLIGTDGTLWKGDKLTVNLREKGGRADSIDLYTKPFRVLADDGAFAAPTRTNQIYQIDGATLTTCTNPACCFHWGIHAKRARIRPGDDLTAWGVVPRFFGIPFFYYPYYWKDLERHYGFRFQPGLGHSWGAFLLSTYKLPIVRNKTDAEFIDAYTFADFRSRRGWAFGEKISWQYGPGDTPESKGYITGYYMPEDEDLPKVLLPEDTERYRLRFNHYWNATDMDQVLVQALYVSDVRIQKDFFRREYKEMTEPENYATYTHYDDAYLAGLTANMRLNDFYAQVERLPEAWFTLNSVDIADTGLYLENDTAVAQLYKRYAEPGTVAEQGKSVADDYDAFRFDTDFELTYPKKYFGFLSVVPRIGYEGTYYDKTRFSYVVSNTVEKMEIDAFGMTNLVTKEVAKTINEEDDAEFRSIFEVGSEVSTRAYGYWTADSGLEWRHVVEPYMDWTFIPEPNLLPTEIWKFDSIDTKKDKNTVKLGVRQRWQFREGPNEDGERPSPKELFFLDVYGTINLDPDEDEETLKDLTGQVKYNPVKWLIFESKTKYNFDKELIDRAEFSLTATHDVFRCDVEYLFKENKDNLFSGYLTWYPNEHWGFDVFGRYEFDDSQVQEVGGWVQHSWDCFVLRLIGSVEPSYIDDAGNEEETDWRVSLTGWLTDFVPNSILEEDNR